MDPNHFSCGIALKRPEASIAPKLMIIVGLAVACAGIWWFSNKTKSPAPVSETLAEERAPTPEPTTGAADDLEAVGPADQPTAEPSIQLRLEQAIAPVTEDEVTAPGEWPSPEVDSMVNKTPDLLAKALDGDLDAAHLALNGFHFCRSVPTTEEGLEQTIQRTTERAQRFEARNGRLPDMGRRSNGLLGGMPSVIYATEAENRRAWTAWYRECATLNRTVFTDSLRDELEKLAEAGDPMARYLFALLPPPDLPGQGAFDQAFLWQSRAREYSYLNLYEGHALGYYAFGHSYMHNLFTSGDPRWANAFFLAAGQCGFTDRAVTYSHQQFTEMIDRYQSPETQPQGTEWMERYLLDLLMRLDDLVTYCR